MFDLISALELAVSAAIVAFGAALLFGRGPREQAWIASGMGAWFLLVVAAGATRTLYFDGGLGVEGLAAAVVLPIAGLTVLLLGTRAGRARVLAASLPGMAAIQTVRVLGVSFVLLHVLGRLPAPFAPTRPMTPSPISTVSPSSAMTPPG